MSELNSYGIFPERFDVHEVGMRTYQLLESVKAKAEEILISFEQ